MDIDVEPPEVDDLDSPFKRRLALVVSLVALFGGVLGYLAGDAESRENTTIRKAQISAINALGAQALVEATSEEAWTGLGAVRELRGREQMAAHRAMLLGESPVPGVSSWTTAYDAVKDATVLAGAYEDHPERLWADETRKADRAKLRQQADQEVAGTWGDRSKLYVGGITLLAVALTLFGLSLTLGAATRGYLVWPGAVLVVVTLAGALFVGLGRLPETPEAAITAVAEGNRLAALRDYAGAIKEYDKAIDARPGYAIAYKNRATARLLAASPDGSTSFFVFGSGPQNAWLAYNADMAKALESGGDRAEILLGRAAGELHTGEYAEAEEHARQAIRLNRAPPLSWMNLTLALLGQSKDTEAAALHAELMRRLADRPDQAERTELYGNYRANLEIVAGKRKAARALADRFIGDTVKAELDRAVRDKRVKGTPAPASAAVTKLDMRVTGLAISATYTYRDIPRGTRLVVLVHYRAGSDDEWSPRSDLTQIADTTAESPAGQAPLQFLDWSCASGGEFKIDMYAEGRRLATATARATATAFPRLVPYTDMPNGFSLCRPEAWAFEGYLAGGAELTSPDKKEFLKIRTTFTDAEPVAERRQAIIESIGQRLLRPFPAGTTIIAKNDNPSGTRTRGTAWQGRLPDGRLIFVLVDVTPKGHVQTEVAQYKAEWSELAPLFGYVWFR